MKARIRDALIIAGVIAVGVCAAIVMRTNYIRDVDEPDTVILPISSFVKLCDAPEKRVYLYIYDKHRLKFLNLIDEDKIGCVYIVEDGVAHVYKTDGPLLSLSAFSDMDNQEIIKAVENNLVSGTNFVEQKGEYSFSVEDLGDRAEIKILSGTTKKNFDFSKSVPQSEIVQDVEVAGTKYCGYLHQSKSVDRFLLFQVEALVTPQP